MENNINDTQPILMQAVDESINLMADMLLNKMHTSPVDSMWLYARLVTLRQA